jgi:hypothetical protein
MKSIALTVGIVLVVFLILFLVNKRNIGEVIRRTETNVRWERDHPVMGEKAYPLHWGKGDSFPMGWCEKRIVNGDEDNVWVKYTVLKQNNGSVNLKPEE